MRSWPYSLGRATRLPSNSVFSTYPLTSSSSSLLASTLSMKRLFVISLIFSLDPPGEAVSPRMRGVHPVSL